MQNRDPIFVIGCGIGPESISKTTEDLISSFDVLAGGKRLLACFPGFTGEKITLGARLNQTLTQLVRKHDDGGRVAILASGDSQFYGITRTVKRYVSDDRLRILPNITAAQALFARLNLCGWENAHFYSLHGKKNWDLPWRRLLTNSLSVIYCDPEHPASSVAGWLVGQCPESASRNAVIGENIGQDNERITKSPLSDLAKRQCSGLSILSILPEENPESVTDSGLPLGMKDDTFLHQNNLITHSEIRAVVIAKLKLGKGIMWDLGAGSGSVGIEAALLCPDLTVYAVEKDAHRVEHIRNNTKSLGVENANIVQGDILTRIIALPAPRAVFIGGGGDDIGKIIMKVHDMLLPRGTIVASAVTLETKAALNAVLKDAWEETLSVSISRAKSVADKKILKPDNPVDLYIFSK